MKFGALSSPTLLAAALALGMGAAARPPADSSRSGAPQIRLSPSELAIYRQARSIVEWTPVEVKRAPSLGKLRPVENQDLLPIILRRAGKTATEMIADFRNIACQEHVYSEWNLGSPIATWREMGPNETAHHFLYIIIPKAAGDPSMFKEYRTNPKGSPIDLRSLSDLRLITTNFTGSWAFFNSANQTESRFRYFGEQKLRKRKCYVIGFAQIPDVSQNVTTFEVGDRSAALLVQGLAWISERSFHILKIETWLLAPREDIGLKSDATTVNYSPVRPVGLDHVLWLPKEVTVDVHYHAVFVRNTHLYSGFRLFHVDVSVTPE